jgi:dihydroflavonol-4-reductase
MGTVILDCMQSKVQWLIHGAYDFVDVRDVAQGMLLAGERGRRGEVYILSGERITYAHLAETIYKILGVRPKIRIPIPTDLARFAAFFAPAYYRMTHTRPLLTPYALYTLWSNSYISNQKAQKELGYRPRSLNESLVDTIHWFLENKHLVVAYQPA